MQIEFIANASFLVTLANGKKLLTDPWFNGPCYYGSWYNFPPVDQLQKYLSCKPEMIYISHIHPDHFHPPTLEHFDRTTELLIPLQGHGHLKRKLQSMGFQNIFEFEEGKRIKHGDVDFVFFKDFSSSSFGLDDGVHYELDSSFYVWDQDGTSLFNANDNSVQPSDAIQILNTFGAPDVAILPASGASLFPHAFTNFSDSEKAELTGQLTQKMLKKFIDVTRNLSPKLTIPGAGSYVMGGAIAEYSRYLHQPTEADLTKVWNESTLTGQIAFFSSGDSYDTREQKMQINPHAQYRSFSAEDRYQYALTLQNFSLAHEQIQIPPEFELEWKKLLPRARTNLWLKQERLKNFPEWEVELQITGQFPGFFRFPYNQNIFTFDQHEHFSKNKISFEIDCKLLLMAMNQIANWNNIEIGALVKVHREPSEFVPSVHNLMSFFHL